MPAIRARPIFAVWNGVWALLMVHDVLATAAAGRPALGVDHFAWNLIALNFWALGTPLLILLVRRFPVAGRRALPHVLLHIGAGIGFSLLTTFAFIGVRTTWAHVAGDPADPYGAALLDTFVKILLRSSVLDLLFYTASVAVIHALDYQHRYQERELRAAQLESQLAQAQVQALRMQLNPHFLFNTLHAISSLMDVEVRKARRMLVDLSDLLRLSLDSVGEQEVPLEQELAFLERYLQIERIRFEDRLTVELDVDEGALDALVPNLLLQPLVENALKHAVAPFADAGHVAVRAHRHGAVLRLEVADDGPGLPAPGGDGAPPAGARGGLGLRNTRERLQRLYGEHHRFLLQSRPGHGLTVVLEIPYHTTPTFALA